MASSTPTARLIVGGLYLFKACFAALMLVLAVTGIAPGLFVAPIQAGVGMAFVSLFFGSMIVVWGGIGLGLLKGSRFALMLAIGIAALNAIGCLGAGNAMGFFIEAAITVGLLMSRDVRSAYSS
jgi:hypothetical protein